MSNLKCRKQKLNGTFECKRAKKIINIKECTNCKHKEFKESNNNQMKKKSSKLSKLERNRYSVFTNNLKYCVICRNKKEHLHEVFFGRNRLKSIEFGFVIPLCSLCHSEMHRNHEWQEFWHRKGQLYFESKIGSRDEFIKEFGKSYLKTNF